MKSAFWILVVLLSGLHGQVATSSHEEGSLLCSLETTRARPQLRRHLATTTSGALRICQNQLEQCQNSASDSYVVTNSTTDPYGTVSFHTAPASVIEQVQAEWADLTMHIHVQLTDLMEDLAAHPDDRTQLATALRALPLAAIRAAAAKLNKEFASLVSSPRTTTIARTTPVDRVNKFIARLEKLVEGLDHALGQILDLLDNIGDSIVNLIEILQQILQKTQNLIKTVIDYWCVVEWLVDSKIFPAIYNIIDMLGSLESQINVPLPNRIGLALQNCQKVLLTCQYQTILGLLPPPSILCFLLPGSP